MVRFLFSLIGLWTFAAFASLPCDCEVRVHSPSTGSYQVPFTVLKTYQREVFSTYSIKNQKTCKTSCLEAFEEDMPAKRLEALLQAYSQKLIEEKVLGFNCTGLTTLKYPIRVKASLGKLGLGNIVDQVHVISHEEICF